MKTLTLTSKLLIASLSLGLTACNNGLLFSSAGLDSTDEPIKLVDPDNPPVIVDPIVDPVVEPTPPDENPTPTPPIVVNPTPVEEENPTPTPPIVVNPTPVEENPTPTPPIVVNPTPTPPVVLPNPETEVFEQYSANGKVDILVISDNSQSMDKEQQKMASRFPNFISGLSGKDWQMGITTTDLSGKTFSTNGKLLYLTGTSQKILKPTTANAESLFKNTVEREETINCATKGECPSTVEEPLRGTILAMQNRFTTNAGFFRDDADFAVVVLSDEDEMGKRTSQSTKPEEVLAHFKDAWGTRKNITFYGVIVKPGDSDCYKKQKDQDPLSWLGGGGAQYGTAVAEAVALTGGTLSSICDSDYGANLTDIGNHIRELLTSVQLAKQPVASSVVVRFTPASNAVGWKVLGNKVVFDKAPAPSTKIEVNYQAQ